MIVFHEGLPRSGKSYEACAYHIIPQLMEGRKIYANISGLNHAQFSELTGIPEPIVQNLLIEFSFDHIEDIEQKVNAQKRFMLDIKEKDCMILFDEIQDAYPTGKQRLTTEEMKFIASHGHDGMDIILMGQCFIDVHPAWRRRVQRKITFSKQTSLGRDNSYFWTAFEAKQPEKFRQISSGSRNYDKKYFGLYKSHTDGTSNKDAYKDKRIVIWNKPVVKYGIPALLVFAFFAVDNLLNFFDAEARGEQVRTTISDTDTSHDSPGNKTTIPAKVGSGPKPVNNPAKPEKEPEYKGIDVFDTVAHKHRPRLSGVIYSEGKPLLARIEILDSSLHRKDVFSVEELIDLGWKVDYRVSGLHVKKGDREYLIRPWPVDSWGRPAQRTVDNLRSTTAPAAVPTAYSRPSGGGQAILINHTPDSRMTPSDRRTGSSI